MVQGCIQMDLICKVGHVRTARDLSICDLMSVSLVGLDSYNLYFCIFKAVLQCTR